MSDHPWPGFYTFHRIRMNFLDFVRLKNDFLIPVIYK